MNLLPKAISRRGSAVAVCTGSLVFAGASYGATLSESFDYEAGALGNQGGWGQIVTGNPASAQVVEGSLTFGGITSSGNKLLLNSSEQVWIPTEIDWDSDSTTYISYLANVSGNDVSGGGRFLDLSFSQDPAVGPILNRGYTGLFSSGRIGIDNMSSNFSANNVAQAGETGFLLITINTSSADNDSITLDYYLDPIGPGGVLATAPTASASISASRGSVTTHIGFRAGANLIAPYVDELRVGSTLADVAPVPEPSSLALLAVGTMAMMRRRRN